MFVINQIQQQIIVFFFYIYRNRVSFTKYTLQQYFMDFKYTLVLYKRLSFYTCIASIKITLSD